MFSSSKKPKFNLSLKINNLSNIPQLSGSCFIKIQIKNRNKTNHSIAPSSSDNINLETSFKKVSNYKCSFNYKLNVNLKFSVQRKNNLISNKYLVLTVCYTNKEKVDKSSHHQLLTQNITELGSVEINLAEYLNFSTPISNKYLLQNSKINSILSLTIFLKQLNEGQNSSFDSNLNINDSQDESFSDSSVTTPDSKKEKQQYNIPTFERKNVFKGLTGVIQNDTDSTSFNSDDKNSKNPGSASTTTSAQQSNLQESTSSRTKNEDTKVAEPKSKNILNKSIILDPIVSKLYNKIFQNSWDIDSNFIELCPEDCVNDIFSGGDGWTKSLKDVGDKKPDDLDSLNGLLSEPSIREDLKSWTVSYDKL